ncbi:hypothetical protein A7J71_31145 [Achromobacter insolitus]|nr:hypothetical protein A3839_03555 [Achromobacter insolitus]OAE61450.1 hypothetical protein A7J71_31145 [Achromobacter insolitus]OCZ59427.1 hypothetical protein A7P22_25105 [Achromobacter insolitus]OWT62968.1 hypothetical protein CEY08_08990 [Achromobacter insolitus]
MSAPPDVVVLCCIPLDRDSWTQVAALPPLGDFVRFVAEVRLKSSVPDAWSFFSKEAHFISRKLDEIELRGMEVVRAATPADLARVAMQYRNVVLIAHWKGMVLPSDADFPCCRLEMHNAMLTAEEFTDLFPNDFAGTVHMIVCTSDIPAETFRRKHPDVICICSDEPMLVGLSLAKLEAALRLMQTDALPLWKALLQAGKLVDSLGR